MTKSQLAIAAMLKAKGHKVSVIDTSHMEDPVMCPRCGGKGEYFLGEMLHCDMCGGTGYLASKGKGKRNE